ncbi:universal stress protein [Corynebacterium sp. sy039]|uniref:universal stress protein n=1 Tax=Corynebacterium sp. sy039 TaxID=2599641 RepID=UPI0011B503BA|nr:universal stress protein [Corynebacterium sp. sy039]QDZ43414.1 universal stress protein [Corynebacterium sp. sy039]
METSLSHCPLRILVAWSPADSSTDAIEMAAWLARTADVKIRCITTLLRPWPSTVIARLGSKYRKWLKKESERLQKTVHSELLRAGIKESQLSKHFSVLADGTNEATLLNQAAKDFKADLIVLSSGVATPRSRFRLVSTADSLYRSSSTTLGLAPLSPKLSKRGVTRINFGHISENDSPEGLYQAAQLAHSWKIPLRILSLSPSEFGESVISERLELPHELTMEWHENTLANLDRLSDKVHEHFPDVVIESDIGSGIGWAGAFDGVKWKKGDLLCLGATPQGTVERVLIGSHTAEILPHSKVPIIMFPYACHQETSQIHHIPAQENSGNSGNESATTI